MKLFQVRLGILLYFLCIHYLNCTRCIQLEIIKLKIILISLLKYICFYIAILKKKTKNK